MNKLMLVCLTVISALLVLITSEVLLTSKASAYSPSTFQSATKNTPAVFGENIAGGDAVFGSGKGDGARGVVGVSQYNTGVEGNSGTGTGVWGSTNSASAAGGEFHNNAGGDLIRAGNGVSFRVSQEGDVFVRGQKINFN